jgi:hypothetical protein
MKSLLRVALAMTIALGVLQFSTSASADDRREDNHYADDHRGDDWHRWQAPCQTSASNLFKACQLDASADLNTTKASCAHIADYMDRKTCESEAREQFSDGRDECLSQVQSRFEVCGLLDERRYQDPINDPALTFINPDDVPSVYPANPYVSVAAGRTLLLRGGEDFEERVVIHVTDEVREVQGVPCRIVWDIVMVAQEDDAGNVVEYEPVEVTQDWFAQTDNGDTYYCGEAVQDYEDGIVISLDGSFEAGTDYANGGFLTKAFPVVGSTHRQELDVNDAEDLVQYLDLAAVPSDEEGGENPAFPCAPVGCLRTFDFSTLSPDSTEYKYYLAGTGFVLAVSLEDGELTGEREELVCTGDGLSVLNTPGCGLEDPDAVRELICELAPDALCEDE